MLVLSKAVQGLLYLTLLALPLAAMFGTWLEGDSLNLVGNLQVAPWLKASDNLGEQLLDAHKLLGDAILWLAGLHAAAAVLHHRVFKDGVMLTMLPRWLAGDRNK